MEFRFLIIQMIEHGGMEGLANEQKAGTKLGKSIFFCSIKKFPMGKRVANGQMSFDNFWSKLMV